jgi:hypothetical protein
VGAGSGHAPIRQPLAVIAARQPICHSHPYRANSSFAQIARTAMLRILLLLIALVIVICAALVYVGYIDIGRNSDGSMTLETKDVTVGTTTKNIQVEVPSVAVENGANSQ